MKIFTYIFLLIATSANAKFQYVAPMPGSTLNSTLSHIIIRDGRVLDQAKINPAFFEIAGSKSGVHDFRLVFSDDHKTILLYPNIPFDFTEEVTVTIHAGLQMQDGGNADGFAFSFTTDRDYTAAEKENFRKLPEILMEEERKKWAPGSTAGKEIGDPQLLNGHQVTGSFTIVKNTDPTPGEIFFDAWNGVFGNNIYDGYSIITTDGDSVYGSAKATVCFDFSVNPNGYLSVFNSSLNRFDVIDSNYTLIDSYYPGNGRSADPHEFTMYADGHAFMIASETHIVDMTVYNPSYYQNATVTTNVIQEFDQSKNVIFEWRGWDHISPLESNQNLAFAFIDVMHTNSVEIDMDGNIIASNRHLSQVNKIDRNTGDFIWRLGGTMNEFTFVNDPEQFSFEHDARILSNGNLTVWDNGNGHLPTHSTAKEYEIDDVNKTATLVWSYNPQTYSNTNAYFYAMGSVRRLDNGNTLIYGGWDNSSNQSNMWEVTPDKEVVWELALNNAKSLVGYRAEKHTWRPCATVLNNKIKVKNITDHSAKISWPAVHNAESYDVQYRKQGKMNWKQKSNDATKKTLFNLKPATTYEYQVRANCINGYASDWSPIKTFTTLPLRIIAPEEMQITLQPHPNPTAGVIHFDISSGIQETATVTVYDLAGKAVFSTEAGLTVGEQTVTYDFTALPAGIYVARFNGSSGSKSVKFVKE